MQRYTTFHEDSLRRYGKRTVRLAVDAGRTCPNRDGALATGGCAFCSGGMRNRLSVKEQLQAGKLSGYKKWGDELRFVAYFCLYTNTYGEVETLRALYEEALATGVDGLAIATRADCIDDVVLGLLVEFSHKTELWVELGMQTVNETTVEHMRRGYSHRVLDETVQRLRGAGIDILLHMIVGLPGETEDDLLRAVHYANENRVMGVKIHSLFLEKGSLWAAKPPKDLRLLEKEEYEELAVRMLAHLHPSIVVHRLTGDPDKSLVVGPLWTLDKARVLSGIQRKLKEKDLWQGKLCVIL